jgi:hypothetical protein
VSANPTVSILIPTYNRPKWLARCVDSIIAQTIPSWEVVIGDHSPASGPGDSWVKLMDDPRVTYYHEKLIGEPGPKQVVPMVNAIAGIATGEAFMCIGDDDTLAPDALEWLTNALLKNDRPKWAYGKCLFVDAKGKPTGGGMGSRQDFFQLVKHNDIPATSVIWNRKMWEKVGLLDVDLAYACDYDYWCRMMLITPPVFIPEVLSFHTVHPDRITDKFRGRMVFDTLQVRERYRRLLKEQAK